jgi:2-(1,2-epoxy-1,2-dihydrophenyl)acetyl-CoA isomerase
MDIEEGVATITMARPAVMNALNARMRQELAAALAEAGQGARVVVLTGEGRAFCSGQDLSDADPGAFDVERTLREEYEPMLAALAGCPVPTVAAVNGVAAGAGANLALAADIVVAAESARFVQAFTRIGLMPDAGGTWFLPRQVGLARAMGAMLLAEPVTARQAADWGMIWSCLPDDALAEGVSALARRLAGGPTLAYHAVKQALRASATNDLAAQLALEARLQGDCGRTADFREGVAAFRSKRPARFSGR